jgi:hypothetical protein
VNALTKGAEKTRMMHNIAGCSNRQSDVNALLVRVRYARSKRGSFLDAVEGKFDRTSTLSVARGLHILRYTDSQNGGIPPVAHISPAQGAELAVEIVSTPGALLGQLKRPGTCLVIRAAREAEIMIGIRRAAAGGTLEATFRLEPLAIAEDVEAESTAEAEVHAIRGGVKSNVGFALLAHLSMRGDVEVKANEWAAGPDTPTPIEGLQIKGGPADGVSMEVQVLVSTRPPRWSGWVSSGEFAGTRGRRLPLMGLRVRLNGPRAERMEVAADALFLGSLIASKRGKEVEFVSSSGADPLVGLRLGVRPIESEKTIKDLTGTIVERGSRVRVFRAATSV